jgi:hypothetical protein
MNLESHRFLKKYGKAAGRERIALRIIEICKAIAASENYKDAINAAGHIYALAIACKADSYWEEKMTIGFNDEKYRLRMELENLQNIESKPSA